MRCASVEEGIVAMSKSKFSLELAYLREQALAHQGHRIGADYDEACRMVERAVEVIDQAMKASKRAKPKPLRKTRA